VLDRGRDWLLAMSPTALAALAALCAVVLTVTAMTLLRPRSPGSGEPTATAAAATSFPPLPSPSAALIVVDVGGRVRHPGLVRLPPGSRVADAVKAAGGALRRTDLVTVDLAALVTDGELLLIGLPGGSPGAGPGAVAAGGKVDLNSATVDQLDALPGIGPVLAARIVAWRAQHGGFHSVDQLQDVPGIGPSIYAELQPLVTA
jgi:competence protein ComEA